ncbi:hypothetical protein RUM44_003373 [Polyplax serrata]|uniref:Peptidase S1 domain-containing protein n=1 Tax=Polyplax serrata TaxID=468196 RepID=A0ABR1AG91_POLSC
MSCESFYIPPSKNCWMNKLAISRGGRIDLEDVEFYCGQGTLDIVSTSNSINVVLLTSYSPGGYFYCTVTVKKKQPSPSGCSCGYKNSMRIVGGSETGVNEYPMMVGLVSLNSYELFCGGTIISHFYILTAAHCLMQKTPKNVAILVGDHDISVGSDTDSAKLYIAMSFSIHPNYNTGNQKNDIALIRVKEKIEFNMKVGPACLPFKNSNNSFAGEVVYAVGWGSTSFGGKTSDKLLHVALNVITTKQCTPVYGSLVSDKQMCTYKDNKDACQSDSGSPLLWMDPNSGSLNVLGIVSYGIQCATSNPSVNTRVSSYLGWITGVTNEAYCIK